MVESSIFIISMVGFQQTRDVDPMLNWCWASVVDGGATSTQHWVNVSCLLGSHTAATYYTVTQCVDMMLTQRLRCWYNTIPALVQRLVLPALYIVTGWDPTMCLELGGYMKPHDNTSCQQVKIDQAKKYVMNKTILPRGYVYKYINILHHTNKCHWKVNTRIGWEH